MSAPDPPTGRGSRPLPAALFWLGVGLSPVAAALLLLADSSRLLRIAAVLALLSVVFIGLSMTLRSGSVRDEVEETLFDEIERLHKDLRKDIETAARATHRAFGEKLQAVQSQVDVLREQLDATGAGLAARTDSSGQLLRPDPPVQREGVPRSPGQPLTLREQWPQEAPGHPRERFDGIDGRAVGTVSRGGIVRHTETVHVTTRQTIVNTADETSGSGMIYGAAAYYQPAGGRLDAAVGDGWAAQRWVGVDEQGREFRIGERRAALRADENGAELRIEDRWAAVRDRTAGDQWRDRWGGAPRGGDNWGEDRWREDRGVAQWGSAGQWDELERVRRDDADGHGRRPKASRYAPQVDFGPSDERWR